MGWNERVVEALESMDTDTAVLAGAISGGQMQVDIAGMSLSYDGAFYGSSSGYGIADSLYDSSGGTVADMLYNSSASKTVADLLYSSSGAAGLGDMFYDRLASGSYEPFWYSGYSLAYMTYALYSCISGGRLLTSPDNY